MKLESRLPGEISTISKCRWYHCNGRKWRGVETVTDCIFLGSKSLWMVTAAMKLRLLLLGRKAMANLDSALKSRDITLPTKVHIVKAMVFPVVMYMSWTINNADWERINAFDCGAGEDSWESLGQQCILKEINPDIHCKVWYWSSNTLTTWYKEQTQWKRPWSWERLRAGGGGGNRR